MCLDTVYMYYLLLHILLYFLNEYNLAVIIIIGVGLKSSCTPYTTWLHMHAIVYQVGGAAAHVRVFPAHVATHSQFHTVVHAALMALSLRACVCCARRGFLHRSHNLIFANLSRR